MPTYRLVTADGDELGELRTAITDWRPGAVIPEPFPATRRALVVLEVRDPAEGDHDPVVLVVRET